ncbi:hypothetical protein [Photobacterium kishitanii]|uniref:Uncharacterized protein n=1 Tax=Photobacterium kishitanii TaxID=318456 RepID=A0A2T3KL30_9GAMM|nr:hypothetical protein [Photobacterium kishitanii]PSV00363.1 hypothetical protein C9J27_04345 [Photobacterium kishitanii]
MINHILFLETATKTIVSKHHLSCDVSIGQAASYELECLINIHPLDRSKENVISIMLSENMEKYFQIFDSGANNLAALDKIEYYQDALELTKEIFNSAIINRMFSLACDGNKKNLFKEKGSSLNL